MVRHSGIYCDAFLPMFHVSFNIETYLGPNFLSIFVVELCELLFDTSIFLAARIRHVREKKVLCM